MAGFFSMLLQKLTAIVTWFGQLFVNIFVSLWDIFRDLVAWQFEEIMKLAVAGLASLNLSGVTANLSFGSIPANVMLVMSCLGLAQAFTLIAAALVIRFTLQLIPFVRLGS